MRRALLILRDLGSTPSHTDAHPHPPLPPYRGPSQYVTQALLTKTLDKLNAQARVSSMSSMEHPVRTNSLTAFDGRSLDGTPLDEEGRGASAYVMEPGWMSFPIKDQPKAKKAEEDAAAAKAASAGAPAAPAGAEEKKPAGQQ